MPTPTYTPLANVTLSSSASSVTFSSIPATYRDLVLVAAPISASGTQYTTFRINSGTGTDYFSVVMSGFGSSMQSFTFNETSFRVSQNAGVGAAVGFLGIYEFLDYSTTNKHKTVIYRPSNAATAIDYFAGRWAKTDAINSIVFNSSSGYAAGSTFTLYGIAA